MTSPIFSIFFTVYGTDGPTSQHSDFYFYWSQSTSCALWLRPGFALGPAVSFVFSIVRRWQETTTSAGRHHNKTITSALPWHLLGTWTTGLHPAPPLRPHAIQSLPHQESSTLNSNTGTHMKLVFKQGLLHCHVILFNIFAWSFSFLHFLLWQWALIISDQTKYDTSSTSWTIFLANWNQD